MKTASVDFVILDWNGTVVPFFGKPLYSGAAEILFSWRSAGIKLIVVSRALQEEIESDVLRVGLELFEVYGCSNKTPVVADIASRLGEGVFMGDTLSDFRAASNSGIKFYQAALEGQPKLPGSDGVFYNWQELPLLL